MGNDKLSYGITILIFGLIFLMDRAGILAQMPYGNHLMSISIFVLIAGIVFILTQPKKLLGWIFAAVGIFLNANLFFGWMKNYSPFIVPVVLILVGIVMIFSAKKN